MNDQGIREALLDLAKSLPDSRERKQRETDLKKQRESLNAISKSLISVDFNSDRSLDLIKGYIADYGRFLYSEISDFIYNIEDAERKNLLQNIEKILSLCDKDDYGMILKLYDHVNLAINQLSNLKQSEEEFNLRFGGLFKQEIKPIVDRVQGNVHDEIQGESKGIINQLISIVSIFTAIAFIVFGGITSLNNIFRGINKAPILKLCILGSIWGLCLLNLIALFMYFIFKLVKSDEKGIIRNDKVIRTGNIILSIVLTISSALYFVIIYNGSWFHDWIIKNANCMIVVPTIAITILFCTILQSIVDHYKKRKTDRENRQP